MKPIIFALTLFGALAVGGTYLIHLVSPIPRESWVLLFWGLGLFYVCCFVVWAATQAYAWYRSRVG